MPAKLGTLSLTKTETGANALAEFTQLHGQGFDLVGGYRTDYGDTSGKATLWVAQAKDSASAQALLDDMAQKSNRAMPRFKICNRSTLAGARSIKPMGKGESIPFTG